MPNTPALVGEGRVGDRCRARTPRDEHLDLAERLLGAVGVVVRVGEPALDAVTGLSGSGPAYVFLVAEALIEAGVLAGLPRAVASQLVVQTLLGSATLLARDEDGPRRCGPRSHRRAGRLRPGCASSRRTGSAAAFLDAVVAATRRSRELGAPG